MGMVHNTLIDLQGMVNEVDELGGGRALVMEADTAKEGRVCEGDMGKFELNVVDPGKNEG